VTPDDFGILALGVLVILAAWPPFIAASMVRRRRRPRPSPAPPASGAPAANPDGGTWLPVGLLLVNFDETFATSNAEPPCPCEACARFDVRVDAVLRARSSDIRVTPIGFYT